MVRAKTMKARRTRKQRGGVGRSGSVQRSRQPEQKAAPDTLTPEVLRLIAAEEKRIADQAQQQKNIKTRDEGRNLQKRLKEKEGWLARTLKGVRNAAVATGLAHHLEKVGVGNAYRKVVKRVVGPRKNNSNSPRELNSLPTIPLKRHDSEITLGAPNTAPVLLELLRFATKCQNRKINTTMDKNGKREENLDKFCPETIQTVNALRDVIKTELVTAYEKKSSLKYVSLDSKIRENTELIATILSIIAVYREWEDDIRYSTLTIESFMPIKNDVRIKQAGFKLQSGYNDVKDVTRFFLPHDKFNKEGGFYTENPEFNALTDAVKSVLDMSKKVASKLINDSRGIQNWTINPVSAESAIYKEIDKLQRPSSSNLNVALSSCELLLALCVMLVNNRFEFTKTGSNSDRGPFVKVK
jgi:hypothetical protein